MVQVKAIAANTPPLAKTCQLSRAPPFSTTDSNIPTFEAEDLAPIFDTAEAEIKYVISTIAQSHPANSASAPHIAAVTAPLTVSDRARQAAKATAPARPKAPIVSTTGGIKLYYLLGAVNLRATMASPAESSTDESSTVDPLIPLSLLQAVRDADRPEGAAEAEYVPEYLNKRLGTTDTVYAQIRRYADAVRRKQQIALSEVIGLSKLIGRRPDAENVFRIAGETAAREAYETINVFVRGCVHTLPNLVARPIARRQARKIVNRYYGAQLERYGADFRMKVPASRAVTATIHTVSASATVGDTASSYYDAGMQELLKLLALK